MTTALLIIGCAVAAIIATLGALGFGYCAVVWTVRAAQGRAGRLGPALFCWIVSALWCALAVNCIHAIRGAVG